MHTEERRSENELPSTRVNTGLIREHTEWIIPISVVACSIEARFSSNTLDSSESSKAGEEKLEGRARGGFSSAHSGGKHPVGGSVIENRMGRGGGVVHTGSGSVAPNICTS